jgi:hypothetical protein
MLAPNQESTVCVDLRMPTTEDVDVVRFTSELTVGGHHIILYKSAATQETTTPRPCSAILDVVGNNIGVSATVPIFIAQQSNTVLNFPPGVGYKVAAQQMMTLEFHFLNTSAQSVTARGTVHMTTGKPETIQQESNLFFRGPGPGVLWVPPGPSTYTSFYTPRAPTSTFFAMTTHVHHLSTSSSIGFGTAGQLSTVFSSNSWDNPPLKTFEPPLSLTAGQGFQLSCSWNNTTGMTVGFGESAKTDEMCIVWGYFYPDTGADVAIL